MTQAITVLAVEGIAEVEKGDSIAELVLAHTQLVAGDVVVVTQKIVSKAEGAVVYFDPEDLDAKRRIAEDEAVRVLRRRGELVITETRHGFVCANSGVDISNVSAGTAVL